MGGHRSTSKSDREFERMDLMEELICCRADLNSRGVSTEWIRARCERWGYTLVARWVLATRRERVDFHNQMCACSGHDQIFMFLFSAGLAPEDSTAHIHVKQVSSPTSSLKKFPVLDFDIKCIETPRSTDKSSNRSSSSTKSRVRFSSELHVVG